MHVEGACHAMRTPAQQQHHVPQPHLRPPLHTYTHTAEGGVVADSKRGYGQGASNDWAATWEAALFELLRAMPADVRQGAASLAIDGTSATAMLVDRAAGTVLAPARLYNEAQGADAVAAAKVRRGQQAWRRQQRCGCGGAARMRPTHRHRRGCPSLQAAGLGAGWHATAHCRCAPAPPCQLH